MAWSTCELLGPLHQGTREPDRDVRVSRLGMAMGIAMVQADRGVTCATNCCDCGGSATTVVMRGVLRAPLRGVLLALETFGVSSSATR